MFVSNDRRAGPHDRRGAEIRRQERQREREKIERIRAFKESERQLPPAKPLMTKTRWAVLAAIVAGAGLILWWL